MVLYGEDNPDEDLITSRAQFDQKLCPDAVIIVGTRLKVLGARKLKESLSHAARKVGGITV